MGKSSSGFGGLMNQALAAMMQGQGQGQEAIDAGNVQWRPGLKAGGDTLLPPIGSGNNPAEVMDWAQGQANTAKDMYTGKQAAPSQAALSAALKAPDRSYNTSSGYAPSDYRSGADYTGGA